MIDTDNVNFTNKVEKIDNFIEEVVEEINKITGIDEYVIGCALHNFDKKDICAYTAHGYCKDLLKCESARQCVKTAINNLFGCPKLNDEDK